MAKCSLIVFAIIAENLYRTEKVQLFFIKQFIRGSFTERRNDVNGIIFGNRLESKHITLFRRNIGGIHLRFGNGIKTIEKIDRFSSAIITFGCP